MIDQRKRISGVRNVGVGLRISRQLCLSPTYLRYVYDYARRTILLSYRWNLFYMIASSAITLFYKASNISKSINFTTTTTGSSSTRVIDTHEPFNYKNDDHLIDHDHRPHGSNGLRQLIAGRLRQLAVRLLSLLLLLHSPILNPTSTTPVAGQQPSQHQHAHRCNHTLLRDRGYHDLYLLKPRLWSSMSFQSMLLLLRNSIIISCIVAAAVIIVAECYSTILWTQYSTMHHLHYSPHLLTTIQHWTSHHHNHYHRLNMGFSSTSSLSLLSSSLFILLIALPMFDFLFRLYPYIYPIVIQDDNTAGGVVSSSPRGLRSNDHIIAIDDEMVLGRHHSIYEITRMLDNGAVGDVVHVSILRIDRKNEDDDNMDSDSSSRGNKNNDNNVVNNHHYVNHHHPQRFDDMGVSCNRWLYQSLLSSLSTRLTTLLRHRHRHAVTERSYVVTREYLSSINPLIQRVMPSRQGSYLGETHVYMILS